MCPRNLRSCTAKRSSVFLTDGVWDLSQTPAWRSPQATSHPSSYPVPAASLGCWDGGTITSFPGTESAAWDRILFWWISSRRNAAACVENPVVFSNGIPGNGGKILKKAEKFFTKHLQNQFSFRKIGGPPFCVSCFECTTGGLLPLSVTSRL